MSARDVGKTKRCAFSQQQFSQQTRQRALVIELRPENEGVRGTLVLPFGLALENGITYQLEDGAEGAVQHFRTCLPVGCVVDVAFDASTVASLRADNQLNVNATADGGQEMVFSVSLSGFSSAHDRVATLLQ
ncbi:invasion associated locus B family protein [Nitratireductor sp. GCM10026969]|uniref:invasion associated locus B family protein n=1 Tax=Nitratireductor sp. GCM10026969 TaxID=3252645 RepID=UPI003610FEF8